VNLEQVKAILVTIIVSLLLAILTFVLKMNDIKQEQVVLQIDLGEQPTPEEIKEMEKLERSLRVEKAADAFIKNENRSNIGVNTADNLKEEISTEKFQEQFQRELSASKAQAAYNNMSQPSSANPDEQPEDKDGIAADEQLKKQQQGKEKIFKGITNIYFELSGRHSLYMPVPVYMCQGSGKVLLEIEVDQRGLVSLVTINKKESYADECLHQAAIDAARKSRFNADYQKSPVKQKGTITYMFVAQ
jgi:TonB family protein